MNCGECFDLGREQKLDATQVRNPDYPHNCGCDYCDYWEDEFVTHYSCPQDSTHHLVHVEDMSATIVRYETKHGVLSMITHKLFEGPAG